MIMQEYKTTWWEITDKKHDSGEGLIVPVYRNIATSEELPSMALPIGALYVIRRKPGLGPDDFPGVAACDGKSVVCVVEGHEEGAIRHWYIEHRASNCDNKLDQLHRCWVRHGTIGEKVTVDKAGVTCGAGAGSFFMGPEDRWHGFLHSGWLQPTRQEKEWHL
jgi:hypothetical protein